MRVNDDLSANERALGTALRVSFDELMLTPAQRRRHLERLARQGATHRSTGSVNANGSAWNGRIQDLVARPVATRGAATGTRRPRLTRALEGVAVVLIVLLFAAGALLARALMPGQGSSLPSGLASAPKLSTVYAVQDDASGQTLLPLDPTTLVDQPGGSLTLPTPDWAVSSDGSTVVTIEYTQGVPIIVVRDGFSGPVRNRVSVPVSQLIGTIALNRDGSRVLVNRQLEPSQWSVIDLASGKLLMSLDTKSPEFSFFTPMQADSLQLSPDGTRLYRFVFTDRADATGPQPLRVIAYDVATGKQLATQTYDAIQVGVWQTPGATEADSVSHIQGPGIAISPDGREIALAQPDGAAIMLIDAKTLAIERTVTLAQPTGLLERVLRGLGIVSQPAAAKEIDGALREAVFSADGKTLYTWGDYSSTASTNGMQGLGLTRVDLANGTSSQVLSGALIGQVQPSPGGTSLYVTGYLPMSGVSVAPRFIQRLDPTSLKTLAQRSWPDVYGFALVAQR